MAGTLYIVATPIGNLGDITERAVEILSSVDAIAAEDTRVTRKLLKLKGIDPPRVLSYYEGKNESASIGKIVSMLFNDKDVALVSDAGSPGISDPGYKLINIVVENDITIDVIPGPSALISALQLSALPCDRFAFFGFLHRKGPDRKRQLKDIGIFGGTVIIYESPGRIPKTMSEIAAMYPDARCAICREVTKLYQETLRGTAVELVDLLNFRQIKGEAVIVINTTAKEDEPPVDMDRVILLKNEFGLSDKDTAKAASILTGAPKGAIYKMLIKAKEE